MSRTKLYVWEPRDGYILSLLERNQGDGEYCRKLIAAVKKVEKIMEKKGHSVCFWAPDDSRGIMGSVFHLAFVNELVKEVQSTHNIGVLEVTCGDATWGKLISLEMMTVQTVQ